MWQNFLNKVTIEFENFGKRLNGERNKALFDLRRCAFESLVTTGIPTIKHEEWKYTNLNFINKHEFELSTQSSENDYNFDMLDIFRFEGRKENRVVLVNGDYSQKYSQIISGKDELIVESISELDNDKLLDQYTKSSDYVSNPFAALNAALCQGGVYIEVKNNVILEEPIHIIYLNDSSQKNIMIIPKNFIIVGSNSQVDVLETYINIGDNKYFLDSVTDYIINEASILNYYKSQILDNNSYQISETNIEQHLKSIVSTYTISVGGILTRNNLTVKHKDEGCESTLMGFYLTGGNNLIDNHTLVEHCQPNCLSNEFYKGILKDESTGVFNGKIVVARDAQKTVAYQLNKNILLSDTAQINAKPQLEIYADDVKCSHGATTGSLDEDTLFYIRSRGIAESEAKHLLLSAFASEIIEKIKFPELRDYLEVRLDEELGVVRQEV